MADEEELVSDRELTIKELRLPEKGFPPYISQEDLDDLDKRDRKVLLVQSVIAQKLDFFIGATIQQNRDLREIQREQLQYRKWKQKITLRFGMLMGGATLVFNLFGGGIGESIRAVIKTIIH